VREKDGLALSSRNTYLTPEGRARAPEIYRSLGCGKEAIERGERAPAAVVAEIRRRLEERGIRDVEYVELVNAGDLSVPERVGGRVLLAVAARMGATRLIDNLCLEVREDGGVEETMLF
jgi:pantoate--beta-alanine ligase